MKQLVYTTAARGDLGHIALYIATESQSREIAVNFVMQLEEQCRKLANHEFELGTLRPELGMDIRSFPFGNYVIFFKYIDDTLLIINIFEGHRDITTYFDTKN